MSPLATRHIHTIDGIDVMETDIESADGMLRATILGWGGVLKDLHVRLKNGRMQRVVLGFEHLDDYIAHSPHFGAIPGRYANRIANGRFVLDGVEYQLPLNQDGRHSLHGGGQGFGKKPWATLSAQADQVILQIVSNAGDAGYPGSVQATATYKLENNGRLIIEMEAIVSDPTILNLCHHSYFNLEGSPDILGHLLQVDAEHYTVVDPDLIPNGEIRLVKGTPFERTTLSPIRRQDPDDPTTLFRTDHNFVLSKRITSPGGLLSTRTLHRAATLRAPQNSLMMHVFTDAPGLQVYDGHKVSTPVPGLSGAPYGPFSGICLESQNFPDAPNHAHFPSAIIRPSNLNVPNYRHVTEYRFTA